jgi:hypothetical protein
VRALLAAHRVTRRDQEWRDFALARLAATGTEKQVDDWFKAPDSADEGDDDPDDDALFRQELAAFGLRMDDDEPG